MLGKLPPEFAINFLDLWLSLSDLPDMEIWVERAREMNQQKDPDEDPDDPETQQKRMIEQEALMRQQAIDDRLLELELALKAAEVDEKHAKSEKDRADAKAKLYKIRTDIKLANIKKAETLNKIEMSEKMAASSPETERKTKKAMPKKRG